MGDRMNGTPYSSFERAMNQVQNLPVSFVVPKARNFDIGTKLRDTYYFWILISDYLTAYTTVSWEMPFNVYVSLY